VAAEEAAVAAAAAAVKAAAAMVVEAAAKLEGRYMTPLYLRNDPRKTTSTDLYH
jgi:hypothetical protein